MALNAVTPRSWPDTMIVSPYRIGAIALFVALDLNGRFQSSSPVDADTPTTFSWVTEMTCRVPPTSAMIGDAYAGPSPLHAHFTSPVFASKAVSAPWLWPPTCTITSPLSAIGDIAVP